MCKWTHAVQTHVVQGSTVELSYDQVITLLGIHLKELKSGSLRDINTPVFMAALFTISKMWNQPKCPLTDEGIKKMWCIHTMEYNLVSKKKEILQHVTTWMNLRTLC